MVRNAFKVYIKTFNITIKKPLYIHSWANCLRENQKLEWHAHGNPEGDDVLLSGNYMVSIPNESATLFKSKSNEEILRVKSEEQNLVVFNGDILHTTTNKRKTKLTNNWDGVQKHGQEQCRISIAWDISDDPKSLFQAVPFFDPLDVDFKSDKFGRQILGSS